MPLSPRVTEVERLLFCSDVVAIGAFRCPSTHRVYSDSEPMSGHVLVFPRTITTIVYEGAGAVTAAPPTILFYNYGQAYSRRKIDAIDSSDWYMIAPDVAREIVSRYDATATDREPVFDFTVAPASERAYLLQRRLHSALSGGARLDPLHVEEMLLNIADAAVREAMRVRRFDRRRVRVDAVEEVKASIAFDPTSNESLRSLAARVTCSPFQLCRDFRKVTGNTITAYRHSLRLRLALEMLHDNRVDVTRIALDLGYSSHSHFTRFFRRTFGITPTAFRASGTEIAET
jgi:AraC family transcriptional regulator